MIRGKYVATIEVDYNINENTKGLLPFEEIKENITGGSLDAMIIELLSEGLDGYGTVKLHKQYADLYRVEESGDKEVTNG